MVHGATAEVPVRPAGGLRLLDARVKLIAALVLILCAVLAPGTRLWAFAAYCGLLGALFGLSRLPAGLAARRAAAFGPFIIAAALFLPFTLRGDGTILVSLRILGFAVPVYREGALAAAAVTLKSSVSALTMVLLVSTTPITELLRALQWLRLPRTLVSVIWLLSRYLLLLQSELSSMMRGARSRGWQSAGARRKISTAGGIIGSLFLRTYDRGERVHTAMLSRGGDGTVSAWRGEPPGALACAGLAGFCLLALAVLALAVAFP